MKTMWTAIFLVLILSGFISTSSAQIIGNADVMLTDVYLEPADPKPGDPVSIKSIVYNSGFQSTKSVTDVVTVGYFVNGDLVKIAELPDIQPGVENGVLLSSGPVWVASEGKHIVTVILNYHDTLSSITDNPSNNIVQRIFPIGEPRPSIILFEVFQNYLPETENQKIVIEGSLSSSDLSFLPEYVNLEINDSFIDTIPVDRTGLFYFETVMDLFDKITPITISLPDNYPLLGSSHKTNIYPIQLERESLVSFQIKNPSDFYNFENSSVVIAIFDDSYDIVKKIYTDQIPNSEKTFDTVFTTLPPGKYIIELYLEGRFLTAIQTQLDENIVSTNEILIPETSKVKFQVLSHNGEPIKDAIVKNWFSTVSTDDNGFTGWIEVLPTSVDKEPYAAQVTFPNGKVVWSDSFHVDYGDQKVIPVVEPK